MAPTKLIAGLIGPLMAAIGIAMLLNRQAFPEMVSQLAQNYAIIFLSGALSLLAGVAIVRVHNVWTGGWPVIITILGWLLIVGGLARMWCPQEGFGNRLNLWQQSDTSSCGRHRPFGARGVFVIQGLRHDDLKEAVMNKITRSSDLIAPKVTTGPLPASTKIYTSPAGRDDVRVPFREIALTDTSEPSFRVYDPSGPYTDPAAAIDVERGLPRIRDAWVKERGGVEAYDGRVIRPEDNGNVSGSHAARAFPNVHRPVRGTGGAPITQYEYARAGIVTKEMIYVAHRENLGRQTQR